MTLAPQDCRVRRLRLGVAPDVLARRAGLAERTVKLFEAAQVAPRHRTVVALRQALAVLEIEADGDIGPALARSEVATAARARIWREAFGDTRPPPTHEAPE